MEPCADTGVKIPRASVNEVPFKCQYFSLKFIFLNTEETLICSTFRALIISIIYKYQTKRTKMFIMYFIHNCNMFRPPSWQSLWCYYYKNSKVQIKNYYKNYNIEIAAET